jgi:hypothetical protein
MLNPPSISLITLAIANDGRFDSGLGGSNRGLFQDGHNARAGFIFRMLPSVTAGGRVGPGQFKDLNESIPDNLAFELLLYADGIAMDGLAVVQLFHSLFEQFYVIHAAMLARIYANAITPSFQIRTPPRGR